MSTRIFYPAAAPGVLRAMLGLSETLKGSALEPELLELVHLRASQINGCAVCLDMHARALRARGEDEIRLHVLPAWRETPFFSDRERAALAWTEAVTRLTGGEVADEVYEQARREFDEQELAELTLAVVVINGWNRLNIAFRTELVVPCAD
ncbi:MAG: carboxymuconolactone decarboxylase family protein, partial [Chloroflexota bacterium]|nr:carboxymuconolactone decarboxylase family protein [Chloroflexota bacterium]